MGITKRQYKDKFLGLGFTHVSNRGVVKSQCWAYYMSESAKQIIIRDFLIQKEETTIEETAGGCSVQKGGIYNSVQQATLASYLLT